jgi:hypothetical protein
MAKHRLFDAEQQHKVHTRIGPTGMLYDVWYFNARLHVMETDYWLPGPVIMQGPRDQ